MFAGYVRGQSRSLDWIFDHMNHQGEECLDWPFSRSRGYGQVGINRKIKKASRIMCELVNGPPPHPSWEAAHSCGRGKQGCVNPRHLSWKTRSGNQQDRMIHGTQGRGKYNKSPRFRLTPQQVAEIRAIGDSMTKEDLARRFDVTPSNIDKILRGETWKTLNLGHRIEDALRRLGRPMSAKELVPETGFRADTIGTQLSVMCRASRIVRVSKGRYALPAASIAA